MTLGHGADTVRRLPEEKPLRIALIVERFGPGTGGVENVAWQVARELVRQGETVSVIAREGEPGIEAGVGASGSERDIPGLEVVRVAGGSRRHPLRALAFSRAADAAIRERRFDVVHGFSRTRHQDLYRAGGGSHDDYLRRSFSPLGRAYRRWLPRHRSLLALERAVFADASQRIQCASRLVADRLCQREGVAPERILLLPNAVDSARFDGRRHAEAGRALRRALDAAAQSIWLFPGSGWHRKGLALCLAAMRRIDDAAVHLWVAGRDDPARWRRRVAAAGLGERVRFLGPRDDLEVVYAAVDGLVLPTRYDAFANVTFEGAASGLPIVTSRSNGAAEWLSPEACLRIEAGDPEALVAALRACGPEDVRRRMGEAARRDVLPHTWPAHVEALRAEYRRIVAARAAARGHEVDLGPGHTPDRPRGIERGARPR
ncbi:MAG: glycosyltransferase family 4 protein [Deltaproteobacteria bacterium]|nr:glycosyltransferase family 4 protein [Deltaproteobacteria bacterium]